MARIQPCEAWVSERDKLAPDSRLSVSEGRDGNQTACWDGVWLHSRYRPLEEAGKLLESAGLNKDRPVLVVGLGLGYHVRLLAEQGYEVLVLEPHAAVVRAALEGPLADAQAFSIGCGSADELTALPAFKDFALRLPQLLIHPPSARIAPEFAAAIAASVTRQGLGSQRLRIAIVGPLYGGSLPIAGYLESAFKKLGHNTLLVDHAIAWPVYDQIRNTVKDKKAANQLGGLLAHALNEWSYARVAEFSADIAIVLAQAPVNASFAHRLRKKDIVSAFWFVENWRHLGYWRDICRDYDYFFHIQPGEFERHLDEAGCPHHAPVMTGADPERHRPVTLTDAEKEEFGCDISFAGAGYYNRVQTFLGLTDHNFKIWGVDWDAKELAPLVQHPDRRFTSEDFCKICAGSKININLHSSVNHSGVDPDCDAINPRVFEIAACGGFQLCDPCKGLEKLFNLETEVPTYRNLPELRERIAHYLKHPEERAAIADRARERVLSEHTYEHRAQAMLDHILEVHGTRILQKGVCVLRTTGEIRERVGADSELGRFLADIPPDTPFTQEFINPFLARHSRDLSYPEQLFIYLREMRDYNESLLAELDA